jgi:protein SCO1/2
MFRFVCFIVLSLVASMSLGWYLVTFHIKSANAPNPQNNIIIPQGLEGGHFALNNTNGDLVSTQSFDNQYLLLYFGYTYCPDYCPTELSLIALAYKNLPSNYAQKLQPLFITVDPDRDTPQLLDEYVKLFDPRIIPLTGTKKSLDKVKAQYKIYASCVDEDGSSDYLIDHSTFAYLVNPQGKLIRLFRHGMPAADLVKALKEAIK